MSAEGGAMWAGEMDAFEAWTEGMEPEKVAFLRVMLYHQRDGASSCSGGCSVRLGTSFAEHQWDEFAKMRPDGEVARLRAAVDEIRRIFALQCPPMAREHYVDSGAWMAHRWWNTVLGGALERIAATEDQP